MTYHEVPDGTRIFYTDTGQGKPVLLLHGWACDGNDWSWQVPELERRYRRSRWCSRRGVAGNTGMPRSGDGHAKADCGTIAGAQRRS